MAANLDCPNSPEFSKEEIEAYTPSNEDEASLNVFGRRRLRILHGQDPEEMPHKFTPIPSQHMQWPSNEEAYAWAKAAIAAVRAVRGQEGCDCSAVGSEPAQQAFFLLASDPMRRQLRQNAAPDRQQDCVCVRLRC